MQSKRLVAAMICLGLLTCLRTQDATAQSGSVAVTDGYDAAVVNPAALAVGNAAGVAGEIGYTEDTFEDDGDAGEAFGLFLNGNHLAYAYRETALSGFHTLAGAFGPLSNVHGGISYRWVPGDFSEGDVGLGLLARPVNAVSAGGRVTFIDSDTTAAAVGVGVRPLFPLPADTHRLTLFGELPYDGDEWLDPSIGISATPIDGLDIDFAYDIEREAFRGAVSFSLTSTRVGNRTRLDSGNELADGAAFVHFSPKRFRPIVVAPEDTIIDYRRGPVVVERRSLPDVWPFTQIDPTVAALDVATEIRELAADDRVEGILFRNHNFVASSANMLEITAALDRFREAGKLVVFYYEGVDNMNYALAASTADMIYLHPSGFVYLTGMSVTRPYVKELFDSLGVEGVNVTSSEYKSLGNVFSEERMPAAEREALDSLLDSRFAEFLRLIEEGRGDRLAQPVAESVDSGPYLVATDALEAGLVDKLVYEDELVDELQKLIARPRIRARETKEDIRYSWADAGGAKGALIYVTGPIVTGVGSPGRSAGSETLARAIRRAREDITVQAIIVRVATGGGSQLASDTIAREVYLTTTGENSKPVVVSMGGTAASGGYYVSAYADRIIAQPTTATASIGVVALIPNIEGLSEKLGVNWETVSRGERADIGAPYRRLKPDETRIIQDTIAAAYEQFLDTVAEGRSMSREAVEEVAKGRIWSGLQAQERGLVDDLGGLYSAIAAVEEQLGRDIRLVEYGGDDGFFGTSVSVSELTRQGLFADPARELPPQLQEILRVAEVLELYDNEAVLFLSPYPLAPEPIP